MRYLVLGCLAVMCFAVCGPAGEEEVEPLTPTLSPPRSEREQVLTITNLKVPDGTRVHFMLGLVGCGVMELGKGMAVVQGGRFELPFDPSQSYMGDRAVDLFIKQDDSQTCDGNDEVLRLGEVAPVAGSVVDASGAESTTMGCWLFEAQR